jgi:hypothetical protein
MAKSLAGKRMKAPKRPKKTKEKIHGKVVKVGKGVGERVGKKVRPSVGELRRKQREMLESMD